MEVEWYMTVIVLPHKCTLGLHLETGKIIRAPYLKRVPNPANHTYVYIDGRENLLPVSIVRNLIERTMINYMQLYRRPLTPARILRTLKKIQYLWFISERQIEYVHPYRARKMRSKHYRVIFGRNYVILFS